MQDADGDNQMGVPSSPSTDSENAMFPSANIDLESENPQGLQTSIGDLSSPPASQGPARHDEAFEEAMELGEDETLKKTGFGGFGEDVFVPGSSWNNRKARDEWQRAWNVLEDKHFSLSEYARYILLQFS